MKKNFLFKFFCFCLVITALFGFFYTAYSALVPCGPGTGKPACTLCDVFSLINNLVRFLSLEVAPVLIAGMAAWGAIVMMIAGGAEDKIIQGKKIIYAAVIGAIIIFSAWIIINTFMHIFAVGDYRFWSEINCSVIPF